MRPRMSVSRRTFMRRVRRRWHPPVAFCLFAEPPMGRASRYGVVYEDQVSHATAGNPRAHSPAPTFPAICLTPKLHYAYRAQMDSNASQRVQKMRLDSARALKEVLTDTVLSALTT